VKINWFSPLPPAMTDVANYAVRVLAVLQEHAEVTLWTDQTEWEPDMEKTIPVRYYEPGQVAWDDLNRSDLSIFNIGNDPLCHGAILQVARRHPGIVILHDLSLQHLFLGIYRERLKDRNGYLEKMAFYYGQQGRECAKMVWEGRLTPDEVGEQFPLTPLALEQAMGVIVHTRDAFQNLKSENRWAVCYAPLPLTTSRTVIGVAGSSVPGEHHHPAGYGQAIIGFAQEVCRIQHPAVANYLTARCAAEMTLWSSTAILEQATNRTAQAIAELCNGRNRASEHGGSDAS
jgi:hypothetical protein